MADVSASRGGRHERYKRGTDHLADWLVKTANECADITRLVRCLQPDYDSKLVIASGAVKPRTNEFVPLANAILQAIRNAFAGIAVPGFILRTIEKVIRLRAEMRGTYTAKSLNAYGSLSQADYTHLHFLGVLQDVECILREAFEHHKAAEEQDFTAALLRLNTASIVADTSLLDEEVLQDIPEQSSAPLIQEHQETPKSSASEQSRRVDLSKAKVELAQDQDDLAFVAWCHLADLRDIKVSITETLEQLHRGEISASLALNTVNGAFELLKITDDAFGILHPDLDDYSKLLECFGLELEDFSTGPVVYVVNKIDAATSSLRRSPPANIIELLCPIGAKVNEVFFQESLTRYHFNKSSYERGTLSAIRPPTAREKVWREHHPFCKVLQINVGAVDLYASITSVKSQNSFTKGLVSDQGRMWLNVCTEIYLDVIDVLGQNKNVGFGMLDSRLSKLYFQCIIQTRLVPENERKSVAEDLSKDTSMIVRAKKTLRAKTGVVNCGDFSSPIYNEELQRVMDDMDPDKSFVCGMECFLPVHAAATAYDLDRSAMIVGVLNANRATDLHSISYLYKALSRTGYVKETWEDLDMIASSYHADGTWVPDYEPDCRLTTFAPAYRDAMGIDRPKLYADKGISCRITGKGRPFVGGKLAQKLSIAESSGRKSRYKTSPRCAEASPGKRMEIVLHSLLVERLQHNNGTKMPQHHIFSPVDLLAELKTLLSKEEVLLNMDFSRLLTPIDKLLHSMQKQSIDAETHNVIFTLRVLAKIGQVMDEHIANAGGKNVAATRARIKSECIKCPRLCEVSEEGQALRDEETAIFRRAGTSLTRAGKIMALAHPELTIEDLKHARSYDREPEWVNLPLYMAFEEVDHNEAKDNSIDDGLTKSENDGNDYGVATDSAQKSRPDGCKGRETTLKKPSGDKFWRWKIS